MPLHLLCPQYKLVWSHSYHISEHPLVDLTTNQTFQASPPSRRRTPASSHCILWVICAYLNLVPLYQSHTKMNSLKNRTITTLSNPKTHYINIPLWDWPLPTLAVIQVYARFSPPKQSDKALRAPPPSSHWYVLYKISNASLQPHSVIAATDNSQRNLLSPPSDLSHSEP